MPSPSRSRTRSAGSSRWPAARVATASGRRRCGWPGWPSRGCAWWRRDRSCRRCASTRAPAARRSRRRVEWLPALTDSPPIVALAAAMPGAVAAIDGATGPATAVAVITAVVDAIVTESVERMELPPRRRRSSRRHVMSATPSSPGWTVRRSRLRPHWPPVLARSLSTWSRNVTSTVPPEAGRPARPAGPRRRVAAVRPCPGRQRSYVPDRRRVACRSRRRPDHRRVGPSPSPPAGARAGQRPAPRPGRIEPGRGVAVHDGRPARRWLASGSTCGCRVLSRRKATPCVAPVRRDRPAPWSAPTSSATSPGRSCSTTSSSRRTRSPSSPRQARPLVQSRRGWVEVDRVDLEQAAAALAEREQIDQLTGRRDPASQHRPRRSGPARRRRGARPAAGPATSWPGPARRRRRRSRGRTGSTVSCAPTRPRRWRGSGSSTPPSSAAASPSTWASARPRPCSPTSPAPTARVALPPTW